MGDDEQCALSGTDGTGQDRGTTWARGGHVREVNTPMAGPARSIRRRARLVALGGTVALTGALLGSTPASAATTTSTGIAGATSATALLLTINLPMSNKIQLELDPVTGTVLSATGSNPQATAVATVLAATVGTQSMTSGTASARLPSPKTSTSDPAAQLASAFKGTPLENLLTVKLLPANAKVTDSPSSESDATVANIAVGLPQALSDALNMLIDPLQGGVNTLLTTLAGQLHMPVGTLCSNLTTAVDGINSAGKPLEDALLALPIPVPVKSLTTTTALGAVCNLSATITSINTSLQNSLDTLAGNGGLLSTGIITSKQTISTDNGGGTSKATAQVAGLTVLGLTPFATAKVLQTTSTATATGSPGGARASVDSTIANVKGGTVDPFADVKVTIDGLLGQVVKASLPPEFATLLTQVTDALNKALSPLDITVVKLDSSSGLTKLTSCPTSASITKLTGTFEASDGTCAAAATQGVGLRVNAGMLTSALGINGPLLSLDLVPSAAVARTVTVSNSSTPSANSGTLPHTGASLPLSGLAATGLIGLALVARRRRTEHSG